MKRRELINTYKYILFELKKIKLNILISDEVERRTPTYGGYKVKVLTLNRRCLPQFEKSTNYC